MLGLFVYLEHLGAPSNESYDVFLRELKEVRQSIAGSFVKFVANAHAINLALVVDDRPDTLEDEVGALDQVAWRQLQVLILVDVNHLGELKMGPFSVTNLNRVDLLIIEHPVINQLIAVYRARPRRLLISLVPLLVKLLVTLPITLRITVAWSTAVRRLAHTGRSWVFFALIVSSLVVVIRSGVARTSTTGA